MTNHNSMDRHLQEIIIKGETQAFLALLRRQQAAATTVLDENSRPPTPPATTAGITILHLAARFGHVGLAAEILRLWPEMAVAENELLETPLHEAAREGKEEVVRLLVEAEPAVVYKVNRRGETAVFAASERGWLAVVTYLLGLCPWLLTVELDGFMSTTSLHVAASSGHTDVVKEILKIRPEFASRRDASGSTPLHLSSGKGHLEITREFLHLDDDLSTLQDINGRTPLHCAAIKGRVTIIAEILSTSLESAYKITDKGETVLHLGVRNNQYEAVKYLVETIDVTDLVNLPDKDGNNVLHLATAGKLNTMVVYLLKLGIDANAINRRGYTALDVIEADASNSGALVILPALLEAGAKRCAQLPPGSPEFIQQQNSSVITSLRPRRFQDSPAQRSSSRRENHRIRREKQIELQNEGLRNARKTITVVAVLIATVTFAAGINPPGGFNQQNGKTLMGKTISFKVFMVCNIIALFLSLGIVIFLVSIIPFKRKSLMKLMIITHKVMWVSTSFMAVAYISAIWTILPHGRSDIWALAAVVGIGGGCTMAIFVGLGVLLARHWLQKWEWRRKRKSKDRSPNSSISRVEEMQMDKRGSNESTSSNSDLDSSDQGYHLY